ncbi:hypothetical protein DM02DRAFT_613918 [Periconia macrospinosa]|uniref:Uncharacterized protein n=1 Tax=Periconia macrospinosa TaxID=97972 RepID=A0A2V1DT45_9PLEO|nr:hypothetical protein DM02DRAFT_613918 [Periconia macrospinosa]
MSKSAVESFNQSRMAWEKRSFAHSTAVKWSNCEIKALALTIPTLHDEASASAYVGGIVPGCLDDCLTVAPTLTGSRPGQNMISIPRPSLDLGLRMLLSCRANCIVAGPAFAQSFAGVILSHMGFVGGEEAANPRRLACGDGQIKTATGVSTCVHQRALKTTSCHIGFGAPTWLDSGAGE